MFAMGERCQDCRSIDLSNRELGEISDRRAGSGRCERQLYHRAVVHLREVMTDEGRSIVNGLLALYTADPAGSFVHQVVGDQFSERRAAVLLCNRMVQPVRDATTLTDDSRATLDSKRLPRL